MESYTGLVGALAGGIERGIPGKDGRAAMAAWTPGALGAAAGQGA